MFFSICQAKQILSNHGFRAHLWGGVYTIHRQVPEYSSRHATHRFHRSYRGFEATHITVAHVRRLAEALYRAETGSVTAAVCGNAVLADRKAAEEWAQAGELCRCNPTDDAAVAELRAGGASRMLRLIADVMKESWQQHHPITCNHPPLADFLTTTTTTAQSHV